MSPCIVLRSLRRPANINSRFLMFNSIRMSFFSTDAKSKMVGIVGMGHVGDAVLKNLVRNGFR